MEFHSERPSLRKKISKLILKRSKTEPFQLASLADRRPPISHPKPISPVDSVIDPVPTVRLRPERPPRKSTRIHTTTGVTIESSPIYPSPALCYATKFTYIRSASESPREPIRIPLRKRSQTDITKMNSDLLKPRVPTGSRLRQVQDAKNMQKSISEKCKRKDIDPPNYEFLELIGKGNYGRVYKSKNRDNQQICAVKIIEVDRQDYKADVNFRDDTITEFIRETAILRSLKDHNAKNVNVIYDAFAVDTQLWIVSEYCPGGSLSTLIKASPKKINGVSCLEENFIIPIAREAAVALKYVHASGVIHRDIKCANILVTEDGRIQLCDFGVSGFLENEVSKRTTIIGTPHWMAPELVTHLGTNNESVQYGTEIDCWAFGAAVYEMATGMPPNHRLRLPDLRMRKEPPKLEGNNWSDHLKDFISFCCEEHPEQRPSAAKIVEHIYIKDTEEDFPIKSIQRLIERFARWEESGNQRESLFNPHGAQGPGDNFLEEMANEDWNFSTSIEFEKRMSLGLDPFAKTRGDGSDVLLPWQQAVKEQQIRRGGDAMNRIFNPNTKPYAYGDDDSGNMSDLPFRNFQDEQTARNRDTLITIDIPDFIEGPSLDLERVETIKARRFFKDAPEDEPEPGPDPNMNRRTMEWKFPTMPAQSHNVGPRATMDWSFDSAQQEASTRTSVVSPEDDYDPFSPTAGRPTLFHSKTMPVGGFGGAVSSTASSPDDRFSMIDIDLALADSMPIPEIVRPQTADSMTESIMTDRTSGDPFDLELPSNRTSLHMKSQSEPTAGFQTSKKSQVIEELKNGTSANSSAAHTRSSSMTRSEIDRNSQSPARRPWQLRMQELDPSAPDSWSGISDEDMMREERKGWERKLGHHRRLKHSQSSNRTGGSSSQGSVSFASQTLRPQPPRLAAKSMARTDLRRPREADKSALLPSASKQMMEDELAGLYEELGYQAETAIAILQALMADDENEGMMSESTSVVGDAL